MYLFILSRKSVFFYNQVRFRLAQFIQFNGNVYSHTFSIRQFLKIAQPKHSTAMVTQVSH